MDAACETLSDDVVELKKLVQELVWQQVALRQRNDAINAELERYKTALQVEKEKYQALQHLVFGRKSEKAREAENPKQSMLFNEAETYSDTPDRKAPVPVAAHERRMHWMSASSIISG